jgi:hypothetical protein
MKLAMTRTQCWGGKCNITEFQKQKAFDDYQRFFAFELLLVITSNNFHEREESFCLTSSGFFTFMNSEIEILC